MGKRRIKKVRVVPSKRIKQENNNMQSEQEKARLAELEAKSAAETLTVDEKTELEALRAS